MLMPLRVSLTKSVKGRWRLLKDVRIHIAERLGLNLPKPISYPNILL